MDMDAQFKLLNQNEPERFFTSGGASKKPSPKKSASKKTAPKKEKEGMFGNMIKAAKGAVTGAVKAVKKVGEKAKKAVMPAKKKAEKKASTVR